MITETSRHLTASMVVFDQHARVLLVHHNATGKWVFPGGHVDPDETPAEAAIREVREETGVRVALAARPAVELPGMTWHPSPWLTAEIDAPAKPERPGKPAEPPHHHIDLLFIGTAEPSGPFAVPLDEVSGARWVQLGELADLDVRAEVPTVAHAAYQHIASV